MNVHLSQCAIEQLADAPLPVQKAFIKQINFLVRSLSHPGLHAKKYDEAADRWQARIIKTGASTSRSTAIPTASPN